MILTAIQTNELGKMMREHITCILWIEAVRMKLDWTEVFSPEQIHSCINEHLVLTDYQYFAEDGAEQQLRPL